MFTTLKEQNHLGDYIFIVDNSTASVTNVLHVKVSHPIPAG